ncbi:MAG: DNA internalization-related competence protein ComEC/Rec2, partial [Nitrospirota bacterium]
MVPHRPLFWMTVCGLAGLGAGELAFYFPLTVLLLLIAAAIIAIGSTRRTPWLVGGTLVVLIGVGLSSHRLAGLLDSPLQPWLVRGPVDVTGRVAGFPQRDNDRTLVILDALTVAVPDAARGGTTIDGRLRLTVRSVSSTPLAIRPGEQIRVVVPLHQPRGLQNPGLFDSGWYARRQGIDAVASVRADRLIVLAPSERWIDRAWRRIDQWRERIQVALEASLSPKAAAVLSAMLIGHDGGLTPELRERFAAAGVAHLLSISGSHLAMLAGVIFLAVRAVCRVLPGRWLLGMTRWLMPTQLAVLIALPAAAAYTVLAGGEVATVRSLLMLALYAGALLLGRPHDLLTALAAAGLVVMMHDPLAPGMISFQLSYGAVLGMALVLLWWSRRGKQAEPAGAATTGESDRWRPWARRAQLYLLLTAAATILTAPLVAYHFRQLNWVGLISNLVVPALGVVMIPLGLLSALLTLLWSSTVFPLATLHEWIAGFFIALVEWFSRWPGAIVHVAAPSIWTLIVVYIVLAALWWFTTRVHHEWRHVRWLRRIAAAMVIVWAMIALAGLARPDDRLRVAFLDVGQGDATAIQFPDGQVMIIDGGPRYGDYDTGRAVVAPYLWDQWRRRINYLVATHPQADHIGAQASLLEQFSIDEVWHNGTSKAGLIAEQWREALAASGARIQIIRAATEPIRIGDAEIDLLHPSAAFADHVSTRTSAVENDLALVLRLRYGEHQFLFTGDIERGAERALARESADRVGATVLKVAHHGSRTSSTPEFLAAVRPRQAVVSVGARNPYRHPAPDVVARHEELGIDLLRTDQDGQVLYISDGHTLTRLTARELALQPARWG